MICNAAIRRPSIVQILAAILALSLAAPATAAAADDGMATRIAASRDAVKRFAAALKGALTGALEAGGPGEAVAVCRLSASAIAAEQSAETDWRVARTSLRPRNQSNIPDDWERRVLETFEARRAAGESAGALEFAEIVADGEMREFRYMKAIPTAGLCLTCHGANIDPALRETLRALYPDDRATGFAVGDIRGAFTIRQPF